MNQKKYFCITLVLFMFVAILFFPILPATPAETDGYTVVPCDCGAYVVDPDPAGLNVRSGPGTDYSIVTKLPTNRPVEVTITGTAGEWMRISGAYIYVDDTPTGDITMDFIGWVYGPLLAVSTRPSGRITIPLYSNPGSRPPVVVELPMETEVRLIGCKGRWLKVRYKSIEGWLDPYSHCGNPVTTCP